MARAADLKDMDVDALIALRADVGRMLAEKGRELERQIALLDGGGEVKRRGRPPGGGGRVSAMRGKSVPPKYRGPGGETWAGRGATPRWLRALLDEGHSVEEFLIGAGRRKAIAAAAKTAGVKKGRKATPKKREHRAEVAKKEAEAGA